MERLKPLWLSLHAHHQVVSPELAPFVSDNQSWRDRQRQYAEIMSGEWFGFIARHGTADIGYLLCAKHPMVWNATFAISPTLWELITLFVKSEWRGKGLGSAMLDAMDQHMAREDVQTKLVGVIPGNCRAIELYEGRGFARTWLTLTRFQRPHPVAPPRATVTIETIGESGVDQLEPLWLSLHHHHQAVSPHLKPFVNDAQSWPIIRELFLKSVKNALLFVAKRNGAPVGLASAAIYDLADIPQYSDTWLTGSQVAETKFLVVAKDMRGQGIGSSLMDAVEEELSRRNAQDHLIGAIEPNRDAIQFYKSRGFRPAWLELVKR
jgi:GNAT superfamily N-acetyltransferase